VALAHRDELTVRSLGPRMARSGVTRRVTRCLAPRVAPRVGIHLGAARADDEVSDDEVSDTFGRGPGPLGAFEESDGQGNEVSG